MCVDIRDEPYSVVCLGDSEKVIVDITDVEASVVVCLLLQFVQVMVPVCSVAGLDILLVEGAVRIFVV